MEYAKLIVYVIVLLAAGTISALLATNQLPGGTEMKIVYVAIAAALGVTLAFVIWILMVTEESKKERKKKLKEFEEKIS